MRHFVAREHIIFFRRSIASKFGGNDFTKHHCEEREPEEVFVVILRKPYFQLLDFLVDFLGVKPFITLKSEKVVGIQQTNSFQLLPYEATGKVYVHDLLQATLHDETLQFVEFPPVLPLRLPRFSKKERAVSAFTPSLEITLECHSASKRYRLVAIQCIGSSHWVTFHISWPSDFQGNVDVRKLNFYLFDSMTDRIAEACVPSLRKADLAAIWSGGTHFSTDMARLFKDASIAYYVPIN